MSRMQPFRLPPKNPLNNETQKLHERMEQESIMKKALMLPDNAGPFLEEFQSKFCFIHNLKLKVLCCKTKFVPIDQNTDMKYGCII